MGRRKAPAKRRYQFRWWHLLVIAGVLLFCAVAIGISNSSPTARATQTASAETEVARQATASAEPTITAQERGIVIPIGTVVTPTPRDTEIVPTEIVLPMVTRVPATLVTLRPATPIPRAPTLAPAPATPVAPVACCKYCDPAKSKPCGDSCIALDKHCEKVGGCACVKK